MNIIKLIIGLGLLFSLSGSYLFLAEPTEEIIIEIDSNTPAFARTITPSNRQVRKMVIELEGIFNDTIMINGRKDGRLKIDMIGKNEYLYGFPPVQISYAPYKASEIDLTYTVRFYDY